MTIEAILFDIDGTLVDSVEQHITAWDEAFRAVGACFDRQTIHDQIGKGSDYLVPALLPGSSEAVLKDLDRAHGEIFKNKFLKGVKPFPGAHDLLARVHQAGQKIVLASSASEEELEHYLDLLDVRDIVSGGTSADDVEHTKPAPDIFIAALKKVAPLKADDVLVVGDTPYDIEAAAKCGIGTIGVRSGKFPDVSLCEAGAVALYDDVAALLADYDQSPLQRRSAER